MVMVLRHNAFNYLKEALLALIQLLTEIETPFDLNIDEEGFLEDEASSLTLKVEKDVDFGNGLITYYLWR
jgi:hypothetical protein